MEKLIVKYGGVNIEYVESSNKWRFELEGRERHAESLTNAKAAIDAPPKPKKKPFKRFEVFKFRQWRDEFQKVTVTSFTDNHYGGINDEAWVTFPDGSREKCRLHELVEITPANDMLIIEISKLAKSIADLRVKKEALTGKLTYLKIPKELKDES